jgi:hypothetical protein
MKKCPIGAVPVRMRTEVLLAPTGSLNEILKMEAILGCEHGDEARDFVKCEEFLE